MRTIFFACFALAFFVSFIGTFFVARLAQRRQILDVPDSERRLHKRAVPTMGGIAVYGSFFLVTFFVGLLGGYFTNGNIPIQTLVAIWAGGAVLMIGGYLDDRYRLPARYTIIFPVIASLMIITSGVSAVSIHNPFTNAIIGLDANEWLGSILSGLVVFIWTMTMTYTTKILDGMDGLVTGISAIAALVLFGLSMSSQVFQPQTGLLAITFAGSLFGFLILNFHPAKIFLGEGGSTFAGFLLAVLAVVSGGKIATTLLVMGIPLLDMIWVIIQRLMRHESPFSGDRKHLHYKLTEIGLSEPQAVLFLYALTGIFGMSALFLQSRGKLIALMVLIAVMLAILSAVFAIFRGKQQRHE